MISAAEIMRQVLRSDLVLDSLYAIPPLLAEICAHGKEDTCSYLGYKGNLIPIVIRRILGIYALAQHSPPQAAVRREGARRISTAENIEVLRRAFPTFLLKLRQYPFDDAYLQGFTNWANRPLTDKLDLEINLRTPVGVTFARMKYNQRHRLRKALGLSDDGVISSTTESLPSCVRDETSPDGVGKLGLLLGHTLRKISSQGDAREPHGYISSYVREYALLRRSFSTLRNYGLVKIFIAYDEKGNPASGIAFLVSGKFIRSPMALGWLGGATVEGNTKGLSVVLSWAIITWLTRNGYERYFMGGIGPKGTQGGPTQFKRGFGGKEVSGHVLWYSPYPLLGELAGRRDTWDWLRQ